MRRLSLLLLLVSLAPLNLSAADIEVKQPAGRHERHARRFILEPAHTLRASERAQLEADGIVFERALANGKFLVRVELDAATVDTAMAHLEPFTAAKKLHATALRQAAEPKPYARLNLLFHDEVSFEAARAAIQAAGGMLLDPFELDFGVLRRIEVRVPTASVLALAGDERVLAVHGPTPRLESHNITARSTSQVDIVQDAPYNLSGDGVVLSIFELGAPEASHREFSGRVTPHTTSTSDVNHATHVSGTMVAEGINPTAKGMAPKAQLHTFRAGTGNWLNNKEILRSTYSAAADNNSWGFVLGWCRGKPVCDEGDWVWYGDEYIGAYDLTDAAIDSLTRDNGVLMVHSSGNDGEMVGPTVAPFGHRHVDEDANEVPGRFYCYSENNSGTDCPTTCTDCEIVRHPVRAPFRSVGLTGSAKNVVTVGNVDNQKNIAASSSRGPTRDGRVKPDLVAKGVSTFSTTPGSSYGRLTGTSMSSPVVTGIAGLLVEQWRKTFGGATPNATVLRAVLIAGAEDLGNVGPDYTHGFGLVNAKNSVDLIRADNATGSRIRTDSLAQGATLEYQVNLPAAQKLRVVLAWADPEVLILGDSDIHPGATLVNDLDVKVVGPGNVETLPYVLDMNDVNKAATRAVNAIDTIEEVEIANAAAGTYRIIVTARRISSRTTTQPFALATTAPLATGPTTPVCLDPNEPNDSTSAAYPLVASRATAGAICATGDVDFFSFTSSTGQASVQVTATDTPLKVTLTSDISQPATVEIAAGATATVNPGAGILIGGLRPYVVRVEPNGALGEGGKYTITATYPLSTTPRRPTTRH